MKALVYHGKGSQSWEEKPSPALQQLTDAIVRIQKTTICGTDLHIMKGNVPTCKEGRILGHEGVGIVEQVGSEVSRYSVGDQVLISCITSCGRCSNCTKKFYGHCKDGGWILGNEIDGCQAERVRIPHADHSLHHIPKGIDIEPYVMLSDILPTGLEVGIMDGKLEPGKTLAIVGAGPVGLAAIMAAQSYLPSQIFVVDLDPNRLNVAKSMGGTDLINNQDGDAIEQIMDLTQGQGIDVVVEAIGIPTGWDISENIVAAGGNIAILGVHGKSVTFHLEKMWKRNFTMTAGLVHTSTIPALMKRVQNGELDTKKLISHQFKLSEVMQAYQVFGNAAQHQSLKVILTNDLL